MMKIEYNFVAIPRSIAKERGIKHYHNLNRCKREHDSPRLVQNGTCLDCALQLLKERRDSMDLEELREKEKRLREKHSDRIKRNMSDWRSRNKDHEKEYRESNRDHLNNKRRENRRENAEEKRVKDRIWREKNSERVKAVSREYRIRERDRINADGAARRAVSLERTLSEHAELTHFVFEEASHLCRTRESMHGYPFHIDHAVPLQCEQASGLHVYYNLNVIPAWHNMSKGNQLIMLGPHDWMQ